MKSGDMVRLKLHPEHMGLVLAEEIFGSYSSPSGFTGSDLVVQYHVLWNKIPPDVYGFEKLSWVAECLLEAVG